MYDCQTDAATEFSFAPETPVRPAPASPAPRSPLRGRFYCLPGPDHQADDLAALQTLACAHGYRLERHPQGWYLADVTFEDALMLNARLGERFVTHCELRLARPVRMA